MAIQRASDHEANPLLQAGWHLGGVSFMEENKIDWSPTPKQVVKAADFYATQLRFWNTEEVLVDIFDISYILLNMPTN